VGSVLTYLIGLACAGQLAAAYLGTDSAIGGPLLRQATENSDDSGASVPVVDSVAPIRLHNATSMPVAVGRVGRPTLYFSRIEPGEEEYFLMPGLYLPLPEDWLTVRMIVAAYPIDPSLEIGPEPIYCHLFTLGELDEQGWTIEIEVGNIECSG
jgi:hypothetical protein